MNNRCIRIDLVSSAPYAGKRWPIRPAERAESLLDLKAAAQSVNATLDLSDLFFPKVFVNDGLAEHRALTEAIHDWASERDLIVIGATPGGK